MNFLNAACGFFLVKFPSKDVIECDIDLLLFIEDNVSEVYETLDPEMVFDEIYNLAAEMQRYYEMGLNHDKQV